MCGRFTLRTPVNLLVEQFLLDASPELTARFNIAPTQDVAIIRVEPESGQRQLELFRWGLIPSWSKDPSIGNRMINARAETVNEKPAFRKAFRQRRCLIPADGYYEWRAEGKRKQPYYIRRQDDAAFAFAGLWEPWKDPNGQWVLSCTIITTDSNELTRPVHDRMPVILDPGDYELWLDPRMRQTEPLQALLQPLDSSSLTMDPVNPIVNRPQNDSPECIEIVDP